MADNQTPEVERHEEEKKEKKNRNKNKKKQLEEQQQHGDKPPTDDTPTGLVTTNKEDNQDNDRSDSNKMESDCRRPDETCNGNNEPTSDQTSSPKISDSNSTPERASSGSLEEANIITVDKYLQAGDEIEDDPIPSGTGSVSKDCSASDLVGWSEILPKWHHKLNQRPKGLDPLVRHGIPEPLRGEVWQLLSGAHEAVGLMEQYRIFLTKSAPTEQIILRDLHRTYPAHENFQIGGSSSLLDSLFKVCKAYAVYDEEVGYCQGLSFLVAALLLHMPEEQAFCVFVRIMQHYGLRDLFRNNFDELNLKFFQLERLLEDQIPDLYQHFNSIEIRPFTYASQWFLTVFTAKFPLNAVFHIMDVFLLDGMNTMFQITLALLGASKQELLALDFEGVLKYLKVQLPKRYRDQSNVQQLVDLSAEMSVRKLKKYAKGYELEKQREKLLKNPLIRLQHENAILSKNNQRLERELAAHQDCQGYLNTISDMEDEKIRLEVEVSQLKEVCRRELQRAESELVRDSSIISDYKKICSQLSKRLDGQTEAANEFVQGVKDSLGDIESCGADGLCSQVFQSKADEFLKVLNNQQQESFEQDNESQAGGTTKSNSSRRSSGDSQVSSSRPSGLGAYIHASPKSTSSSSSKAKILSLSQHIDELEIELARTKLALVEAECKCQQLTHDLNAGVTTITSGGGGSSFSARLDFVKAAVATRRPTKTATTAFTKINNLISEKISTTINSAYNSQPIAEMAENNNSIASDNMVGNTAPVVSDYKSQC